MLLAIFFVVTIIFLVLILLLLMLLFLLVIIFIVRNEGIYASLFRLSWFKWSLFIVKAYSLGSGLEEYVIHLVQVTIEDLTGDKR
jgi:hypothetical protein